MKKAVLLMSYGSPEEYTFEGVKQFFTNIRKGRSVSDEEINHLLENYKRIGDCPLPKINKELINKFKELVNKKYTSYTLSDRYAIYFANKFSTPFIPNVIETMEQDGIEQCICLILEPHYSFYSIMGYEKFIKSDKIKFNIVKEWYYNDHLVNFWVDEIKRIIEEDIKTDSYKIIFSAHSVPTIALDYGDPYIDQIYNNTQLIVKKLNLTKEQYTNTWQSESDIGIPWIKPDVLEYLREQKTHPEHYIFVPISFISEHIEVLFDNDIECKEICDEINVQYHRPPMPNFDDRLVLALESTIEENKNNEFLYHNPEDATFNEMKPSEISQSILNEDSDLKMPDFVKKLIEKKGKENVKMPTYIKKMLEKKGKI